MGSHVDPMSVHPVSESNSAPSAANPITAAAVASTHGGEQITSKTTISSLEDLKKKSPKLYQQMMMGIGMSICREMQRHQDDLKKLMREYSKENR